MKLFRNISIRTKLFTLTAPALLVILYFALLQISKGFTELDNMNQLRLLAELAEIGDPLTEALQRERGRSAVFLASPPNTDAARQAQAALKRQRQETSAQVSAYRAGIADLMTRTSFNTAITQSLEFVESRLDLLPVRRNGIDRRAITASESASFYTQTIMGLIDRIPLLIQLATTPEVSRYLNTYYGLAEMAERAGRERAVGASLIRSRQYDLNTLRKIAGLGGQQQAYLGEAMAMLDSADPLWEPLKGLATSEAARSMDGQRATLFSGAEGLLALQASDWFATATRRIGELNQVRHDTLTQVIALEEHGVVQARGQLIAAASIAGGAILIVVLTVVLITRAINTQVGHLLRGVQHATHNKDLTQAIQVSSRDEVGTISSAVNDLFRRFGAALLHIDKSSIQLATATEQTNSTAGQNATHARSQQQQIEQAAAATEEMSATSEEISRNTVRVADAAKSAMAKSHSGEQVLERNLSNIRSLEGSVKEVNQVISELEQRSTSISDVVEVIRKVADQTNLLALNAAIEAARAGEHGRGFAVVADEVRALARQTHQSTTQIEDIINGFRDITERASASITESHEMATATTRQAAELEQTFADIFTEVNSISDMAEQIATAAEEQVAVTQELASSMETVSESAILTLSGSQEISQVTEEQAKLARQLQDLANEFRVAELA